MKFGLFGTVRSMGSAPDADQLGYQHFIDYVVTAEQLGFTSVFVVEHHFSGLGQVSSPLQLLTFLAARTSTIRLGTAVTVVPWHNPILLAEQVATLDLLSGGRLDLGVGRGYRPAEFHGFGLVPSEAQPRFDEGVDVLVKGLTTPERFSHAGEHWEFADVVVEPRPVQLPHPPMWTGAGSERSIRDAARRGHKLLLDMYGDVAATAERLRWYRDEREQSGRALGDDDVALTRALMVMSSKDQDALDREYDARVNAIRVLRHASEAPGQTLGRDDHAFFNDTRAATEAAAIAGTPDICIERLRELESIGINTVLFNDPLLSAERLQLFAREVMPAFAEPATGADGSDHGVAANVSERITA